MPKADKAALIQKISDLASNLRPHGSVKLDGVDDTFRIRHGNFRVVYKIEDGELIVLIVRVARRKHVYR